MRVRRLLAVIFVIGALGLGAELLLLGHVDEPLQLVPLALLGAGVAAVAWHAARPGRRALVLLRAVLVMQVAAGLVGFVVHYRSNVEFEREMYPDLGGFQLVREALTGAIPALAPGALIQLALVGLAYTIQENTR